MKQYLLDLIAEGKLGESIAEMRQFAHTQNKYFQTMLIQLSGQYAGNERDNAHNTIEPSDYKRSKAKLSQSLIYLLDTEFEENKVTSPLTAPNSDKQENPRNSNHKTLLKEQIFKLIDTDIKAAFRELDKTFLHENDAYMDLVNEFANRPSTFSISIFIGKLKFFVHIHYGDLSPLKILMMTANPTGTAKLNLDKEYAFITQKLEKQADKFQLVLRKAVSSDEFKEFSETLKPNLLHFSGHGEKGKKGGIFVQNEDKNEEELILTAGLEALFEYLQEEKVPIIAVLLNACYSEEQAQAIAQYVPYVIGTTVALGDKLAIAFSTGFYFKLGETNFNFESAFKSGRTQAIMAGAAKSYFALYKDGKRLGL